MSLASVTEARERARRVLAFYDSLAPRNPPDPASAMRRIASDFLHLRAEQSAMDPDDNTDPRVAALVDFASDNFKAAAVFSAQHRP